MVTLIVTFLMAHGLAIIGLLAGAAGIGWGAFKHQQANAATSAADAKVAGVNAAVSADNAAVEQKTSNTLANQNANQKAADLLNDVTVDTELKKEGGLRD